MTAVIEQWSPRVGVERACRAFGVPPRTWNHRRQASEGRLPPRPSRATGEPRRLPDWTLPPDERDRVRAVLCEDRFADLAPAQVWAALLDEGTYLCSISTMYRILRDADLTGERRRGHRRTAHTAPRVGATGPNQVWSWDISRLRGPAPRSWFYLYVLLDIYSRKIVGWTIDTVESDKVARTLIRAACRREGVDADTLTLHSDRGAQMTSTTIAELLEDLGVTRSLSRPRTSNDNPYSEANFKTAKYRPDYPARFASIDQARTWMRRFARWYNHDHYHSGIGYLHPADVHAGTASAVVAARQTVLDAAYQTNPARFRHRPPHATAPPTEAWINKPTIQTKT
ncbi:MAG: IS3 family transposase [Acidimicrobiales bacterium]